MDKTKPFGLVLPKRAQTFPVKSNAAFDSDSDDEPAKKKACTKIPQAKPLSKNILKAEQCEDPSIYEYDSIYDDMKAKEVAKIAPQSDKPSRYIDSLLKAADKRKKNYERRLEKKVHAEREREGDKFIDKEAFVTSAYKKKMQEMEEEEERERRESQLNDMMDVTKQKDLSGFYRHFLKQSVGEEKIPVFGERIDIKKEPETEPDSIETVKAEEDSPIKDIEPNLDQDSDIVSSSDDEASGSGKILPRFDEKAEKSSRNNKCVDNHSNDESENKIKKKSHRQIRKKAADDDSDDELEVTKTEVTKSQRHLKKTDDNENISDSLKNNAEKKSCRKKQNTEDADSDSSSESNFQDIADQGSEITNELSEDQRTSKSVDDHDTELKKIQKRKNIFEKRTVGSAFTDAQARYFQRMAARSA